MGTIYVHKNKINRKCYVGQSVYASNELNNCRWNNGKGYKNTLFGKAIKRYGWDNFEHIILLENVPNNELDYWETYYIGLFHSFVRDPKGGGYNVTLGGKTSPRLTWTKDEDLWIKINFSKGISREKLYNKFIKEFPKTNHTLSAFNARLKTLRLSKIENVNRWSNEDDKLLIKVFKDTPNSELVKMFPTHSLISIYTHANTVLKLKRGFANSSPPYSVEEDEILSRYYKKYGLKFCQRLLPNRTKESIKTRIKNKLKLRRGCEKFTKNSGFNLLEFRQFYETNSIEETAKKFNIKPKQVSYIATRNGIKRQKNTINHAKRQKIYCVELKKIFNSLLEIRQCIGCGTQNIPDCCNGKRKTSHGYHWQWDEKK